MAAVAPDDPRPGSSVDRTRRTFVDYIERTREHYLRRGFDNPYAWAFHDDVPFAALRKPLAESTLALVTTAAEYGPEHGDQGPHARYNTAAKFREVYTRPLDPPPDLRISHLSYDRANTVPADVNAYFPLAQLRRHVAEGRLGALAPRFYGAPTLYSQRHTREVDAPAILRLAREDGADAALLVAI